jgi:hypothetical protein
MIFYLLYYCYHNTVFHQKEIHLLFLLRGLSTSSSSFLHKEKNEYTNPNIETKNITTKTRAGICFMISSNIHSDNMTKNPKGKIASGRSPSIHIPTIHPPLFLCSCLRGLLVSFSLFIVLFLDSNSERNKF